MDESRRRGCWKGGCIGCAALIAVVVGIPLILMAIGVLVGAPDVDMRQEETRHALPRSPEMPPAPGTASDAAAGLAGEDGAGAAEGAAVGSLERDLMPSSARVGGAAGRVRVDLAMGEFIVEPGPQEEGIRVEADYDAGTFELVESFEPAPDGTWDYRLELKSSIGWFRRLWADNDSSDNEIRLILPRDQPISLAGSLGLGQSEVDLSGLWLTDVDLELKTGKHTLVVDEPSPVAADFVRIDASMGELRISGLGNLSPLTAEVDASMGELRLDLEGEWRQDSDVTVDFGMGQCTVQVPRDVHVDLRRVDMSMGEKRLRGLDDTDDIPEDAPTVRLSVSGSMGELVVDR